MEVKDYLGKTGLARFLENCKKLFAPKADLEAHTSEANPHNITKTEVGLENVDNTSDAEKPVSTAQAAAIADAKKAGTDAQENLTAHNTNTSAHTDLRLELKALADRINAALDSDDETLDELSEIVAYIKSNKSLIEAITTGKVSVADIVNDLVTNVTNKPLSAAQGVALKALIDTLTNTVGGKAPTSHASVDTTYGAGTGTNYGHVKLSDATNGTSGASGGVAATPAAVKAAYDAAGSAQSAAEAAKTAADGKAPASHTQAASTITAGTFAGAVVANGAGQAPETSLLRNSRLVAAETDPTVNGEICWTYE